MKILHTSDWHLGKRLEGSKRIEEQKKFVDTLEKIVNEENPQLILIAGDIFDTPSPSSEAEKLFFDAMKKISNFGKRAIVIIPGNHDSAERLVASKNLAKEFGIIIYEKPFEEKELGKYGEFEIERATQGGALLNIDGERVYIYSLPYMSEAILNDEYRNLFEESDEDLPYTKKIGRVLKYGVSQLENIPKVVMAHLFIMGSIGDGDERGVELGGSKGVDLNDLPDVDYIALGHIHKPVKYSKKRACYSGSPIEYRVTENRYKKKVIIAELKGELQTDIREIELENYKPIKRYEVIGVEEAINLSKELMKVEEWVYLKVETDRYLSGAEIREIKKNKNIVELSIAYQNSEENQEVNYFENGEINIKDSFIEYYKKFDGIEPSEETIDLFMELLGGEE
ncbi:exonuclease subunit SbcD [Fusobacterium sp.]|uniref:metallophosphoesterase family protein n=1 Tax=Fusobacterium sp. TaxID=68766 RepID=UPI0025B90A7B|nr:exonuclease subunit SbcD [Fusobacterium sp.]